MCARPTRALPVHGLGVDRRLGCSALDGVWDLNPGCNAGSEAPSFSLVAPWPRASPAPLARRGSRTAELAVRSEGVLKWSVPLGEASIMRIDSLREDGIGDILVEEGKMDENTKERLLKKYGGGKSD